MPFTKMAALIVVDPERAAREILAAFKSCGASAEDAAKRYGVTRRQFDRWVKRLGIEAQIAELRDKQRAGK